MTITANRAKIVAERSPALPPAQGAYALDLNRIHKPRCAFSEFTTCPLPPDRNVLEVRVESGEKHPLRRAG